MITADNYRLLKLRTVDN